MLCTHCLFARLIFAHTSLADDGKALPRRNMSPESHRREHLPQVYFLSLKRLMDSFKRYKAILRKILKVKCGRVCLLSGKVFLCVFFFFFPHWDESGLKYLTHLGYFLNPGLNGVIAICNETISST